MAKVWQKSVGHLFLHSLPSKLVGVNRNNWKITKTGLARRARSRLRQLILASGCDHLLTLTYRENITDYRQACLDLSRFVRKVKRVQPGFLYVGVPEK
jgi:hypothetical protein